MDLLHLLPTLLGAATLLPLASFLLLLVAGRRLGRSAGGYVAAGAIVGAAVLSLAALLIWLGRYPVGGDAAAAEAAGHGVEAAEHAGGATEEHAGGEHASQPPPYLAGDYYQLAQIGRLRLSIGYYIDSLTICMFCMVSLIASCIHIYSWGYMHEELEEVTDPEVALEDGTKLRRPGRYWLFFLYMSLFSFSMLGLVLAGNIAMVFVFWELVGICSYFLIGFYIERRSACLAANKAFIVNRVGDFGMIVGMAVLWASLGTFAFGDMDLNRDGVIADTETAIETGIFHQVRPADQEHPYRLRAPDGMVRLAARHKTAALVETAGPEASREEVEAAIAVHVGLWREGEGPKPGYGYGLLILAGIGIFCGCVGKSAQFPLHVWLPDAMEGPTPVSALVHSATMVAAGVYLVGRFFPVFAPEVLLVIAVVGCITLFMAATIAITATDIKRVLAYSTVSQLGYMMLALGVGGWIAGLLHLVAHAFFKSLLFLCSGSVIHAVHTNEMTEMGGLRRKMPITAYTMLVGCVAISGLGIPFIVGAVTGGGLAGLGLSGFYSKDAILEQSYSFLQVNGKALGAVFFIAAVAGAAITSFYIFRMWYMTFAGRPRNEHRYEHAHESPRVMTAPLVVLAFFAIVIAWRPLDLNLVNVLEQARPAGTLAGAQGQLTELTWPGEHASHAPSIVAPVALLAVGTALAGFILATLMYGLGRLNPRDVRRRFPRLHQLLIHKWWFDELYDATLVRPSRFVARCVAAIDRGVIDRLIDGGAWAVRWFSDLWDRLVDRLVVDGLVNLTARWTYAIGLRLRVVQTGEIRQYVVYIVVGAIAIFLLITAGMGGYG